MNEINNIEMIQFKKPLLNREIFLNEIILKGKREGLGIWGNGGLFGIGEARKAPAVVKVPQANVLPPVHQIEIVSGTQDGLAKFIAKEPQKDQQGRFRYLLTSGVAVEVVTGTQRFHHDTDLVIFDYRNQWWKKYATDNVVSQKYWADMEFDPAYLEETAWEAKFAILGKDFTVSTVHPAIILTQKLSDAWGRTPRLRDLKDAVVLARFWLEHEKGSQRWVSIIETAISVLPKAERPKTQDRIAPYIEESRKWSNPAYRFMIKQVTRFSGSDIVPQPLVQACKP